MVATVQCLDVLSPARSQACLRRWSKRFFSKMTWYDRNVTMRIKLVIGFKDMLGLTWQAVRTYDSEEPLLSAGLPLFTADFKKAVGMIDGLFIRIRNPGVAVPGPRRYFCRKKVSTEAAEVATLVVTN